VLAARPAHHQRRVEYDALRPRDAMRDAVERRRGGAGAEIIGLAWEPYWAKHGVRD